MYRNDPNQAAIARPHRTVPARWAGCWGRPGRRHVSRDRSY
ncbi:hypothetical protein I553_1743 [Mycobacterium xenopi 4042]|uniref:Uncharacterized protein n=1 Tax=Mycobacterium xenopi 4042 TaxID=1299334 RepID=X8DM50_MYCXE|nr:hypothetical protein I553_1743 [Mycobacterium xenopi 4042]